MSLFITARRKDGDREVIRGEKLFSIDGFKRETIKKVIINDTIKLRATNFWYKNAFDLPRDKERMYTNRSLST